MGLKLAESGWQSIELPRVSQVGPVKVRSTMMPAFLKGPLYGDSAPSSVDVSLSTCHKYEEKSALPQRNQRSSQLLSAKLQNCLGMTSHLDFT
jgi:hypothetical protein